MAKEIERKFLLAEGASIPIPEGYMRLSIKQGYIHVEKGKQIRVRLTKFGKRESANVCIKYTSGLVRDEFDFFVGSLLEGSLKEAKELYKKCEFFLEKKRLTFQRGKEHYDVDTYPNGMQWVEVEFKSIKDMKKWEKKKPHWIGKEITDVRKYSNIALAKKKLKFNGKRNS
jgi:CYTH domain-containing protein